MRAVQVDATNDFLQYNALDIQHLWDRRSYLHPHLRLYYRCSDLRRQRMHVDSRHSASIS